MPFLELAYTASAIDIGISHCSMDSRAKKRAENENRYKIRAYDCAAAYNFL
jgi:hypothetical protein